jgi:hypothetical protein
MRIFKLLFLYNVYRVWILLLSLPDCRKRWLLHQRGGNSESLTMLPSLGLPIIGHYLLRLDQIRQAVLILKIVAVLKLLEPRRVMIALPLSKHIVEHKGCVNIVQKNGLRGINVQRRCSCMHSKKS